MGWRDFLQPPDLVEKKEKKEKTPAEIEKIPFIPFIPPGGDSENPDLTLMDHLDETSKEAFREYVDFMTGPKYKMPLGQARKEALKLVLRNLRTLQASQAAKDYRRDGYIKIFSAVLNQAVYLVRDERAAKQVPDKSLSTFLEADLEAVKGLGKEEAKMILEAKLIFGGPIKVEDTYQKQKLFSDKGK
ncbi:MAG: hypothetical protein IIA63_02985 [Nitrospinae bacterium]|nr:hypothetical protein [Nitrospinota bacterium]